ncbi:uncharacterized protein 1c [SARS coronavirus ZJ0301]|uniref:Uncharacterized protein 1c n=1 Tax=SARS coronavirus ZJ0301 TaxID=344702 RepID=Q3S2E2_SARS|nr:uncharacterized protein 1c [SARS coronavirus ZJ0301]
MNKTGTLSMAVVHSVNSLVSSMEVQSLAMSTTISVAQMGTLLIASKIFSHARASQCALFPNNLITSSRREVSTAAVTMSMKLPGSLSALIRATSTRHPSKLRVPRNLTLSKGNAQSLCFLLTQKSKSFNHVLKRKRLRVSWGVYALCTLLHLHRSVTICTCLP